jgi:hypothetical protein
MNMKKTFRLLPLEASLVKAVMKKTNTKWSDTENCLVKGDEIIEWNDYLEIPLKENVTLSNGQIIDSVLVFGDCTIEFHDYETWDAENWSQYPTEDIEKIICTIKKL